jgi:hypothetical protein
MLEAAPAGLFTSRKILTLHGKPFGGVAARTFSSTFDIERDAGPALVFKSVSLMSRRYELQDAAGTVLGSGEPAGLFTRAWDLVLSGGEAKLASRGVFDRGFNLMHGETVLGTVEPRGTFASGWRVAATLDGVLSDTDLLLAGMIFDVIASSRKKSS